MSKLDSKEIKSTRYNEAGDDVGIVYIFLVLLNPQLHQQDDSTFQALKNLTKLLVMAEYDSFPLADKGSFLRNASLATICYKQVIFLSRHSGSRSNYYSDIFADFPDKPHSQNLEDFYSKAVRSTSPIEEFLAKRSGVITSVEALSKYVTLMISLRDWSQQRADVDDRLLALTTLFSQSQIRKILSVQDDSTLFEKLQIQMQAGNAGLLKPAMNYLMTGDKSPYLGVKQQACILQYALRGLFKAPQTKQTLVTVLGWHLKLLKYQSDLSTGDDVKKQHSTDRIQWMSGQCADEEFAKSEAGKLISQLRSLYAYHSTHETLVNERSQRTSKQSEMIELLEAKLDSPFSTPAEAKGSPSKRDTDPKPVNTQMTVFALNPAKGAKAPPPAAAPAPK